MTLPAGELVDPGTTRIGIKGLALVGFFFDCSLGIAAVTDHTASRIVHFLALKQNLLHHFRVSLADGLDTAMAG